VDPIQLSESSLRILALLGLLCQAAAIGLVIWFCVRAERHLGSTHALLATLAARTDVSLKALQGSQRALQVSADSALAASRQLETAARVEIPAALDGVTDALVGSTASTRPQPSDPTAPLLAQIQAVSEERNSGERELARTRKQLAESGAELAGLRASNTRLLEELRDKRREARTLQSSLGNLSIELSAVKMQLARLRGPSSSNEEDAGGTVDEPADAGRSLDDEEVYARTRALFEDRIGALEQANGRLSEQLATTREELERTSREKGFIEQHYLGLAEA
jgi:uncharacterized phage infection (PIP) family protein YhgE